MIWTALLHLDPKSPEAQAFINQLGQNSNGSSISPSSSPSGIDHFKNMQYFLFFFHLVLRRMYQNHSDLRFLPFWPNSQISLFWISLRYHNFVEATPYSFWKITVDHRNSNISTVKPNYHDTKHIWHHDHHNTLNIFICLFV
jgi:hypothetical protein